jgi:hypothetical protein
MNEETADKAAQSQVHARYVGGTSQVPGRCLGGECVVHRRYMHGTCVVQATRGRWQMADGRWCGLPESRPKIWRNGGGLEGGLRTRILRILHKRLLGPINGR